MLFTTLDPTIFQNYGELLKELLITRNQFGINTLTIALHHRIKAAKAILTSITKQHEVYEVRTLKHILAMKRILIDALC